MNTTFERLGAILAKDYRIELETLQLDARLESLGIDSLGAVELLWSVEDAFGIKLPHEPVPLATVRDVVAYIDAQVAAQATAGSAQVLA